MTEILPRTIDIPGIEVPAFRVGYGTYHLLGKMDASAAIDSLGAAFKARVNVYDTSDNYGTELLIGRAVSAGVLPRDRVIIAAKTGLVTTGSEQRDWEINRKGVNTNPDRIRKQIDNSLRTLGEDVGIVDIYQLHVRDPEVEHVAHAEVMQELIEARKIRAWGVSNYSKSDLDDLLLACDEHGLPRPSTSQPFHNMLDSKSIDDVRFAEQSGLIVLAHSPLLKGALTHAGLLNIVKVFNQINASDDEDNKALVAQIEPVAAQLVEVSKLADQKGLSLAKIALAWTLQDLNVITLTTPTNDRYLREALSSLDVTFDLGMQEAIDSLRANPDLLDLFQRVSHKVARQLRGY